jgi:alkylation response protein AidB-like acyl-CoA dehydrogenase
VIPARHGGAGLGILDAAIAAECLGYHAVPAAFAASLIMAPLAVQANGGETQQHEWLPRIATGEARIALGFAGAIGQTGVARVACEGNRLSGRVQSVLDGSGATHIMVYLADGRPALVAVDAEGVRADLIASLDATRPLLDVTFEDAPAVVLSAGNQAVAARSRVLDAGRLMLAADTLGAAQSMLDQAVAFAKQRVQFGRVIGSFQGVKHTLADLATALEPCRALVWYAAHAQDTLPDEARLAALQAKAHLDDVGREVARLTTEVHGGMGFTDLQGLHYWFKRIATNRQLLGTPERCRHEAACLQGWVSG